MASKALPTIVAPAKRGSKRDWLAVSAELAPPEHAALMGLVVERNTRRTDVIREAVVDLLRREGKLAA